MVSVVWQKNKILNDTVFFRRIEFDLLFFLFFFSLSIGVLGGYFWKNCEKGMKKEKGLVVVDYVVWKANLGYSDTKTFEVGLVTIWWILYITRRQSCCNHKAPPGWFYSSESVERFFLRIYMVKKRDTYNKLCGE